MPSKVVCRRDGTVLVDGQKAGKVTRYVDSANMVAWKCYSAKGEYLTTQYSKRLAVAVVAQMGRRT